MKAKDLMIGDWVRIKSDIDSNDAYWLHDMQPGQALKVTEILSNGINPDWYGGEINDFVPENAIAPIPLTPEILEKNGWLKYGPNFSNNNIDFELESYRDAGFGIRVLADEYGSGIFAGIEHVHELQHALRLCGIEKEIVL